MAQESSDPQDLKRALAAAIERQKEQEATIKKLRHEVDVERGHATILRHDNQVLRQMKANMVSCSRNYYFILFLRTCTCQWHDKSSLALIRTRF